MVQSSNEFKGELMFWKVGSKGGYGFKVQFMSKFLQIGPYVLGPWTPPPPQSKCPLGWVYIRIRAQETRGSRDPLNGPYFRTQDWVQA